MYNNRKFPVKKTSKSTLESLCKKMLMVLVIFIFNACWDKQNIDTVLPPVPLYTLSGNISELNTFIPLENIIVKIKNSSTAYEGFDTTVWDTTDINGFYEFPDAISPGFVTISCYRQEYKVFTKNLVMNWKDRSYNTQIPRLAIAEEITVLPNGLITGLAQKNENTISILNTWSSIPGGQQQPYSFTKIWESIDGGPFNVISNDNDISKDRKFKALDFNNQHYITASDSFLMVLGEDTMQVKGFYYHIDPTDQSIINFTPLPVRSELLKDISVYRDTTYICTNTSIVKWINTSGDTINKNYFVHEFTGICIVDNNRLIVYDNALEYVLLYVVNSNLDIIQTYKVMFKDDFETVPRDFAYLEYFNDETLFTTRNNILYKIIFIE